MKIILQFHPLFHSIIYTQWSNHLCHYQKIDLRHLLQSPDSDVIDVGIDLQDYYISVEWEILKVPAVRNEKVNFDAIND